MIKKAILLLTLTMCCGLMFLGCGKKQEEEVPAIVEEEPTSSYDEEFIKVFSEAVTYRQDLGKRVSFALTPADVLKKELDKHPDYSEKVFDDEILKHTRYIIERLC